MPSRARSAVLAASLVLVCALVAVPLSAGRTSTAHDAPGAPPTVHTVTLVTGDVVHDVVHADGKHAITLEPGPDGTIPNASITEVGDHVYVVPQKAMPLLAHERLDLDLFDVAGLVRQGYDD